MNIAELIRAVGIQRHSATKIPNGGDSLKNSFDLTADDFLIRAEDDFEFGGAGAEINVLTNAKRAIDCQIDSVLNALGYSLNLSRHRKLQFLAAAGFVAPQVLKRVIDARNLLEHEYRAPSHEEAADALEIATLFVNAIARHFEGFESDFTVGNVEEYLDAARFRRQLRVSFDHEQKIFRVVAQTGVRALDDEIAFQRVAKRSHDLTPPVTVGTLDVSATDPAFPLLVRLVNAGDRDARIGDAVSRFFDYVEAATTA